jgi:hypothetical protein
MGLKKPHQESYHFEETIFLGGRASARPLNNHMLPRQSLAFQNNKY